ncbi:uncharacterized protein [Fopius arisanus]|uniref:Mchl_0946 protein n=1 Tax=Fopius arisanus TaxID=64838 RepID=A0A0C9QZD7_9HYME|nr:PREDICTED: uncharacterized protein LOC105268510 [Fopius arisanus]
MADTYTSIVDILRKKSRSILSELEKNSRLVEDGIRKLKIKSVNSCRGCISEASPSWKIRNDSTGVNDLLNPSNRDMTVGGRILISSKRPGLSLGPRKPVPGCYCTRRPKKVRYRSVNTICRPIEPCHYCRNHTDGLSILQDGLEAPEAPVSPALSNETLQKVQSIRYTPRSEFLRKVQRKVSEQSIQEIRPEHSPGSHSLPQSSRTLNINQEQNGIRETRESGGASSEKIKRAGAYRERNQRNGVVNIANDSTITDSHPRELIEVPVQVHRSDTSSITPELHDSDDVMIDRSRKSKSSSRIHQREFSPEIETILPSRVFHKSKSIAKKTISSTKRDDKGKEHKRDKSRGKSEVVRTLSQKSCHDVCCEVNERRRSLKKSRECCRHDEYCLSCLASGVIPLDEDRQTRELRKFREKNYFDTHESSQAISISESSGSLEQFELNSRLFPEPVGRISKDNIMVSMPVCATTQMKRIHYFPRSIVREGKKSIDNSSKKRHKGCPLTGHAIDLGVLKTPCPANSLALKHQKGVV